MKTRELAFSISLLLLSNYSLAASKCFTALVEVEDVADGIRKGDLNKTLDRARDYCLSEALKISNDPKDTKKRYVEFASKCEKAWGEKSEISKKFCIMDAALQVQAAAYYNENIDRAAKR